MYHKIINTLKAYHKALKQEFILNRQIFYLRDAQTSIQINIDGMPKGTNLKTYADYMVQLESLEGRKEDIIIQKLESYNVNRNLIERIEDEVQKNILDFRYMYHRIEQKDKDSPAFVSFLSWYEISQMVGYSEPYVKYMHSRAIEELERTQNLQNQL